MTQLAFGTGQMWARPLGSEKTPVEFGILQNVAISIDFDTVAHYGRKVFPIHMSRGHARVTGIANFAAINARLFSDVLFGGYQNAPVLGTTRTVVQEVGQVTGGQITVVNAAFFTRDLGVVQQNNADIFEKVLAAPLARQYACNETTGVYSFGIESENRVMLCSYTWADAANGKQVYLTNPDQAAAPAFSIVLHETFNGKALTVVLNSCVAEKLTMQNRLQDFAIPGFGFRAQADANGVIGTMSFDEDGLAWLVSAVYPLSFTDSFTTPGAALMTGRATTPPLDTFNATVGFGAGTLSNGLNNYSNGLPETFNGTVQFTGGNLVPGLQNYSNGLPETFNASQVIFMAGNLVRGLQTYQNGLPETFNASAVQFTGGTLS